MNNKNIKIKYLLSLVLIIVFSVFSFQALALWSPRPGLAPDNNNTPSPLSSSSLLQYKTGSIIVNGFRSVGPSLFDSFIQIPTNAGVGKVLTSDAGGNATWQTPAGGGGGAWTRDSANAVVRLTNNNDKVGLGLTNPTEQLEITNNFRLPNTTGSTTGVIYKGSTRFIHDRGTENIFLGHNAGNFTLTGQRNVGTGFNALLSNTSGSDNTAVGYRALESNTTGNFNTALGSYALRSNTSGYQNTAVGYNALRSNTTGYSNIALGTNALFNNTTGNNHIAIGANSGPASASLVNTIAIGANVSVSASNRGVLGNTSTTGWGFGVNPDTLDALRVGNSIDNGNGARLTTTGTWTSTSDLNKKTNIKNLSYGLKDILKLRPVNFDWKESKQGDIGFIAQEVKKVIPELVNGQEGDLALSYANMTTVLTRAIQEQNEEIEMYRNQLESLKIRLNSLQE